MKKGTAFSYLLRFSIVSLIFLCLGCKSDDDDKKWDNFLSRLQECHKIYESSKADCDSRLKAAQERFNKCYGDCQPIAQQETSKCPSKPGSTCFAEVLSRLGTCEDKCKQAYQAEVAEIEKCRKASEDAYWQCLTTKPE